MDTSTNTESIEGLINDVENKDIVLPEFQRDFVWEMGKTYDLYDSLVKKIFIGSIIYGVPSFEITTREIDLRPRSGKGSRGKLTISSYNKDEINKKTQAGNFRLLLDGQQRITSLYRSLKGIDAVWFIAKHPTELENNGNYNNCSLEEILLEFTGQQSSEHLSIKISDVFDMMQNTYRESVIRKNFFLPMKFVEKQKTEDEIESTFEDYLTVKDKIRDLFKSEKLLSYYLLDTTLEKFALFFERSNSRGIQLNFIDILAAKLYHGFNLRDSIDRFQDNNSNYKLNKEIIVRAISFIVSDGKDLDRSYILKSLTADHFSEYWDDVCQYYKKTLDFLYENHLILSQSWIPYENMLLPLMMYLKAIGGNFSQMNEHQWMFIKYWYWASIFSQRYTGSSNEIIIQDSKMLLRIAQGEKITDRNYFYKLKSKISSFDELHSFTKKGSVIYRGILNLINYHVKGLIDWKNSSKLSFNHDKLDDHHIFPKKYLESHYKNNDEVLSLMDSVVNRTLIPKITNIIIGKKPPKEYLDELKKCNPALEQSLDNHLIPSELITGEYDDEYLYFLTERADNIFQILKEHVLDKHDIIHADFYQDITHNPDKIKIFGKYNNKTVHAFFYPLNDDSEKVEYKGELGYPSTAANNAKKEISGKETATNGWEFWKYIDEQGQEKFILELRE